MESKKLAVASAAAAAVTGLAAGASYLTTKVLVDTAVDRDEPGLMKKASHQIAGYLIPQETRRAIQEAEKRLLDAPTLPVEISAHDGLKLAGHWYLCENAKRVVIAMHGWRSAWSRDYGLVAPFMHDNGCSVLFAEQRGQNNSGGDYIGFGLTERFDCLDWVDWAIKELGGELPIYLCGLSMGATTVLMAAGLELPENVRGIVSDCGFTSPEAIWEHIARDNLHISYGWRKALIGSMYSRRLQVAPDEYSTLDAMKVTKTPILFIHGTDDHFVPIEMTYENYKACAAPKKLLVVPGADHGMSFLVEPAAYEGAVKDFWREHDGRQSP